jgi:predicted component of type VI protein secretion system
MEIELVVLTPGKMKGQSIPVASGQFLIGRDAQCHLRPASASVSKRHCVVLIQGDKAFVRDLKSTNGTFVNAEPVQEMRELLDGDRLRVGPLDFRIALKSAPTANKPIPAPASSARVADDAAAAFLLSPEGPAPTSLGMGGAGIPEGSTIMEPMPPMSPDPEPARDKKRGQESTKSGAGSRAAEAKKAAADTSAAAEAILKGYRRPRH